jgi:hypothetical protein
VLGRGSRVAGACRRVNPGGTNTSTSYFTCDLSFWLDRASMPMHAGGLTREGLGHSGVILFRRSVASISYGAQARLLLDFWKDAANQDWSDRVEYLPGTLDPPPG